MKRRTAPVRTLDREEQARVDRALEHLDAHLDTCPISPRTRTLIFDAAARALLLRNPTDPTGWVVVFWSDTTDPVPLGMNPSVHVTTPTALAAVLCAGGGRLAYVVELAPHWRAGAGDQWVLAETAERIDP